RYTSFSRGWCSDLCSSDCHAGTRAARGKTRRNAPAPGAARLCRQRSQAPVAQNKERVMKDFRQTLADETKAVACDLKAVDADGSFAGYASRFGVVDLGRDLVLPGAFAESLARRGPRGIKMLFQHDTAEPIGVWLEVREDAHGLYVRGRI